MFINTARISNSLETRHAFLVAGAIFTFFGALLLDTTLMFSGNLVLSAGVLLNIKSFSSIRQYYVFLIGLFLTFKFTILGILVEIFAVFLWLRNFLTNPLAVLSHTKKLLYKF